MSKKGKKAGCDEEFYNQTLRFGELDGTESTVHYERAKIIDEVLSDEGRYGKRSVGSVAAAFWISAEYVRVHRQVVQVFPDDLFKRLASETTREGRRRFAWTHFAAMARVGPDCPAALRDQLVDEVRRGNVRGHEVAKFVRNWMKVHGLGKVGEEKRLSPSAVVVKAATNAMQILQNALAAMPPGYDPTRDPAAAAAEKAFRELAALAETGAVRFTAVGKPVIEAAIEPQNVLGLERVLPATFMSADAVM